VELHFEILVSMVIALLLSFSQLFNVCVVISNIDASHVDGNETMTMTSQASPEISANNALLQRYSNLYRSVPCFPSSYIHLNIE
jgi:hypothetical protein